VSEYVRDERASGFKAERAKIAEKRAIGPDAVSALAKTVGYAGDTSDDTAFARAIRAYTDAVRAGL
jgi:hypothetical protein